MGPLMNKWIGRSHTHTHTHTCTPKCSHSCKKFKKTATKSQTPRYRKEVDGCRRQGVGEMKGA